VFRVRPDGLEKTDQVASGGTRPVSVAVYHDIVYVLNQDTPNIAGFVLNHNGELDPLPDSRRTLAAGSYAQVGFTPDGDNLVITGRTVNTIVTFGVDRNGVASAGYVTTPSSGAGPFGFIFDPRGNLLVAEAGVNAVSSYKVRKNGMLDVISASVLNGQTATCWITDNGKYVFTANPGTHTFSSYSDRKGDLQLLDGAAGSAARPLDMHASNDGRFLYALDSSALQIVGFRIKPDGSLVPLPPVPAAIDMFAQGLAAR
jgi:6-phosphogluconolactonase (cycloisomerase 2 family)